MKIPCILGIIAFLASVGAAQATTMSVDMAADNEFFAFLSTDDNVQGTLIGSGNDWTAVSSFSAALTPGVTNYLHIVALNFGGPAGFLGQVALSDSGFAFPNGSQSFLTQTTGWKGSVTGFGTNYVTPDSYGANGVAPWGNQNPEISSTAQWIWAGSADGVTTAYFSLAIIPTTSVPDGGSTVVLLGLTLFGIAALQRRFPNPSLQPVRVKTYPRKTIP